MKVSGMNPETHKKVESEIESPNADFFESMRVFNLSDESVRRIIGGLNISADAKSLLYNLSKATIAVGEFVIKIGRKILDIVCQACIEFPNAAFGTVFGVFVGAIISSIPILGQILGPIVAPILVAVGFVGGLILDVQNKILEQKIKIAMAQFSPLANA